jgi:hypothetical protein
MKMCLLLRCENQGVQAAVFTSKVELFQDRIEIVVDNNHDSISIVQGSELYWYDGEVYEYATVYNMTKNQVKSEFPNCKIYGDCNV